jgi:catechol 2,3-dioxygenase-like lactoylglutathione lyase family enzyme
MELQINIDCADADALADFYCRALGYSPEGSVAQYRSVTADGLPKLVFQQVPEARAGKNRVHLDVIVGDDIEGVASRFVELGASRGERRNEFGMNWIVMRDPEGNEICICDT